MPHLRKKGRLYYAEFYDPDRHPKRKYVPLRTGDKSAANNRMVELDRAYARGEKDPWTDKVRFGGQKLGKVIEEYLRSRTDRRARTQQQDRNTLERFASTLPPDIFLHQVGLERIRGFIDAPCPDGEPRTGSTRSTYYARLSTFFNWAVAEGLLLRSPMDRLRKPKVGDRTPLYLTREQYRKLIEAIEADAEAKREGQVKQTSLKPGEIVWLRDVVQIAVGTGLRAGELSHLRWSAVNLIDGHLTVRNTRGFRTKSGHERHIPLEGDALDTIRRMDESRSSREDGYVFEGTSNRENTTGRLNGAYVNKRFKKYAQQIGLPEEYTFHTLRHTYASWLVMAGVSLYVVRELMGHKSIETTMKYAHLAPSTLRNAVSQTFGSSQRKDHDGAQSAN